MWSLLTILLRLLLLILYLSGWLSDIPYQVFILCWVMRLYSLFGFASISTLGLAFVNGKFGLQQGLFINNVPCL